jgi:hypothetical protein
MVAHVVAWPAHYRQPARDDRRRATTVTAFHYLAVAWLMLQHLILLTSSSYYALAVAHQHLYGLQLALRQPLERRRQLLRRDLQLEDSVQA